jgi:hypothetical protein
VTKTVPERTKPHVTSLLAWFQCKEPVNPLRYVWPQRHEDRDQRPVKFAQAIAGHLLAYMEGRAASKKGRRERWSMMPRRESWGR